MTPRTALAEVYGAIQADDILETLRRAGLVAVDKGAIGRAQREAVRQWEEDNDAKAKETYNGVMRIIDNPQPPTPKLRAAFQHYKEHVRAA